MLNQINYACVQHVGVIRDGVHDGGVIHDDGSLH